MGKTVVIFFVTEGAAKGCTIESCGFRDLMKEREDFPTDVVYSGASRRTPVELSRSSSDTNMLRWRYGPTPIRS